MNFERTARQKQLWAEFAAFGREVVAQRAQACSEANEFDRQSWQALTDHGFWALIVPVQYGGKAAADRQTAWWDFTAAAEGLATEAFDGGFVLSVTGQAGLVHALEKTGTEAQKSKYFPSLLRGGLAATCIAERQGGTDLSGIRTELTGEPGSRRLNGEKWNISHAPDAEMLLVAARIPAGARSRLTTLLLDVEMQGISRGDPDQKTGNRTLPTGWLRFEGVKVAEENILGMPGKPPALQAAAALQRIYYGLLGALLPDPLLRRAEAFVQGRTSMGEALSRHQYVQRRITQSLLLREQAVWMARAALGKLLTNGPRAMMLSSMAKLTGASAAIEIARELTTLMGSSGYLEDDPGRLLRDLLAWEVVGGTEEAHRINIFQQHQRLKKDQFS
jgi:alkylation response protein AidB-like acyl-CoA dehydrogenase